MVEYIDKAAFLQEAIDIFPEGPDRDRLLELSEAFTVRVKDVKRKDQKNPFGEFGNVLLTRAEHEKLIKRFGTDDTSECIRFLDEYIEEKGSSYKSRCHYLAIIRWVIEAVNERRKRGQMSVRYGNFDPDDAFKKALERSYEYGVIE